MKNVQLDIFYIDINKFKIDKINFDDFNFKTTFIYNDDSINE